MAGVHGKGQTCHVLPNCLRGGGGGGFPPGGSSARQWREPGEAEGVFLSISISQRENGDDRRLRGSPSLFTPRNTVCDTPRPAPVSAQPPPMYTQTAQDSNGGGAKTAGLSTHTTPLGVKSRVVKNNPVQLRSVAWFGGSIVLSGRSES